MFISDECAMTADGSMGQRFADICVRVPVYVMIMIMIMIKVYVRIVAFVYVWN